MFSVFLSGQFIIILSPKQIRPSPLSPSTDEHTGVDSQEQIQLNAKRVRFYFTFILLPTTFFHHDSSVKFFFHSWALYSSCSFPFFNLPAQKVSIIHTYMTQCQFHRSTLCIVMCKVQLHAIAHSHCETIAGGAHSLATTLHYSPYY